MNDDSKPKATETAPGSKIRMRALLIGSILALAICLITPFNNAYRQGTPLGGGHFPLAPFYILVWMMLAVAGVVAGLLTIGFSNPAQGLTQTLVGAFILAYAGATLERAVTCVASDGSAVTDEASCTAAKPETTKTCVAVACPACGADFVCSGEATKKTKMPQNHTRLAI